MTSSRTLTERVTPTPEALQKADELYSLVVACVQFPGGYNGERIRKRIARELDEFAASRRAAPICRPQTAPSAG